ncbi:MAG: hypothetical protein JWO38_6613 [Gemmataceae bacterium]|nr:hypothetical protein [Gemmataceae bacterium]
MTPAVVGRSTGLITVWPETLIPARISREDPMLTRQRGTSTSRIFGLRNGESLMEPGAAR